MTLETLYYSSQIIAVVAILASLIAIYFQQRQNHALARAEHEREALLRWETVYDVITRDPEALKSVRICLQDYEDATSQQQAWFGYFMHIFINITENVVFMQKDKLAHDESLDDAKALIRPLLAAPGGRQYWDRARLSYGVNVRRVLDDALREPYDGPQIWELYPFYAPDKEEASDGEAVKFPQEGVDE
ncbi:hypothetical protein ACFFUB_09050 [Algimonas porphyrae]|uniref:DUF4760 domain-containing protein n=1 Tax=Algimonas porphyrae TaxID=1128113 RepID=A0ABQ5V2G6_9PROT|nr:hypothetical protein [Algimonas porphyrae]GLQ21739.1 hypothetical protein GCM10007854_26940 [Algimonas porphyrae]